MKAFKKIHYFLFLFALLIWGNLSLAANDKSVASPAVSLSSDFYDQLDVLEAHKLISQRFVGMRPYTRAQFAEFVAEAKKYFDDHWSCHSEAKTKNPPGDPSRSLRMTTVCAKKQKTILAIIENLEHEFAEEIEGFDDQNKFQIKPLRELRVDSTLVKSDPRPYFEFASSSYAPLTSFSGGRHFRDGMQISAETTHDARYGDHFSATLTPRFQLQFHPDGEDKLFLQNGYATAAFWRHRLNVGRHEINWGLGRHGGIFLSNNARPLDSIELTNDKPWSWGVLGLFRYNLFIANLGPEYNFSKPYLASYKLSLSPKSWLEMSLFRGIVFGGKGAPASSFGDIFLEYLGYRSGDINAINRSNAVTGVEARVRIPNWRGLEIYGESSFDDLSKRHFFRSWVQDNGILFGIFLPRVDDAGTFSARLEARRLTTIMYKHSRWTTGWAENGNVMGDPLGPDSESLSLTLHKFFLNPDLIFDGNFAIERIDSDVYGGNAKIGRIVSTNGNAEHRFRSQISGKYGIAPKTYVGGQLGYEHVSGYNFTSGDSRNNALLQAFFEWRP